MPESCLNIGDDNLPAYSVACCQIPVSGVQPCLLPDTFIRSTTLPAARHLYQKFNLACCQIPVSVVQPCLLPDTCIRSTTLPPARYLYQEYNLACCQIPVSGVQPYSTGYWMRVGTSTGASSAKANSCITCQLLFNFLPITITSQSYLNIVTAWYI